MTRDLRKYARQTNVRLFIGFLALLVLVGDGLIALMWGQRAALLGLLCIALGLAPLLLIGAALWVIEKLVKRVDDER